MLRRAEDDGISGDQDWPADEAGFLEHEANHLLLGGAHRCHIQAQGLDRGAAPGESVGGGTTAQEGA